MAFRIVLGLVLLGLPLAKGLTFSHSQGGDTATWELHLHGDELHVTWKLSEYTLPLFEIMLHLMELKVKISLGL